MIRKHIDVLAVAALLGGLALYSAANQTGVRSLICTQQILNRGFHARTALFVAPAPRCPIVAYR
jgi:hypothetical protein